MGSLSKVTFTKAQGGVGAPLPGEDYISGLVDYQNPLATYRLTFEDALITDNSVAVHTTGTGGIDDTHSIVFASDDPTTLTAIATYLKTLLAGKYVAITTGAHYIEVTMKLNMSITIGAVVTLGETQTTAVWATSPVIAFSDKKRFLSIYDAIAYGITAANANTAVLYYYIDRFFRRQPSGVLYLWLGDDPEAGEGGNDFAEVIALQQYAVGKCRQIAVFLPVTFDQAFITALQGVYEALSVANMPALLGLGCDTSSITDHSSFDDNTTLDAEGVEVIIAQDGANIGASLAIALGSSVPALGQWLGAYAFLKVSQNIGWRSYSIADDDGEMSVPAIGDGTLVSDIDLNTLGDIQAKAYVFALNEIGLTGTFFNDGLNCTDPTSDYFSGERVRTIDKAIRNVRAAVLPGLNGQVPVDPTTGQLASTYIAELTAIAQAPLDQMNRDGELSGASIIIDPTQNVNATSKIAFTIKMVSIGISRDFDVTIGYVTSI